MLPLEKGGRVLASIFAGPKPAIKKLKFDKSNDRLSDDVLGHWPAASGRRRPRRRSRVLIPLAKSSRLSWSDWLRPYAPAGPSDRWRNAAVLAAAGKVQKVLHEPLGRLLRAGRALAGTTSPLAPGILHEVERLP